MSDSLLRSILWNALFLCVLLHIDTYLVPRVGKPEKVVSEQIYRTRRASNYNNDTWIIETDKHTYYAGHELYDAASVGDTIILQYSGLLRARQSIETNRDGLQTTYVIGHLYGVSARMFIWALMIAIIVLLRMLKRIDYPQGKVNLTICFALMALVQLVFYFDLF